MTEPVNPPRERWWSPSAGDLILEHGDCYALSEPHLMIEGLPADAIQLVLEPNASRLKTLLWQRLGRGPGRDIELIDAVSDMADHRTSLVAELAREKEIHAEERAAHEAWLLKARAERDEALEHLELVTRDYDIVGSQRATALAIQEPADGDDEEEFHNGQRWMLKKVRRALGATDGN